MTIETERLELIPLSPKQLKLWTENIAALEKELAAVYMAEPMKAEFLEIVRGQLKINEKDPDNYLWHSFCAYSAQNKHLDRLRLNTLTALN